MGSVDLTAPLHVVAVPYPGRGHVNPLMNLCKLIASSRPEVVITFVLTEEWYGFVSSESKPANITFATIPNCIPSEVGRAKDVAGFVRAVNFKMEAPVERLLDSLDPPTPGVIISDSYLPWMVKLGKRRNIPVASLWPMSPTVYSIFYHQQLLLNNGHFDTNLSEKGEEVIHYIPGVPLMQVKDLPPMFPSQVPSQNVWTELLEAISTAPKAQCLLFTSIAELDYPVIEALKFSAKLQCPVYSIGPAIPYLGLQGSQTCQDYLPWLDAQPKGSVLYISQGSFLSLGIEQLDEIIGGMHDSGVRFFWVARGDVAAWIRQGGGNKGLVVPWCDQLKLLCHPSVGGFWSHCGWNSTKEGAFAGIPFLTFPIAFDQFTNSKQIVEDWKIGWRVRRAFDSFVPRQEIAQLVKRFMESECDEVKEMRKRAKEIAEVCKDSIEGGLVQSNIDDFLQFISRIRN